MYICVGFGTAFLTGTYYTGLGPQYRRISHVDILLAYADERSSPICGNQMISADS